MIPTGHVPAETEGTADKVLPDRETGGRVLVVDDDAAACKLLSIILSPPAFRCATARSGEEALVALQRERFEAVVSDLHMPGISGMELLAEVRRRYPHMAFLVTTGVDDVDVGVQAMRCGADNYLVNPSGKVPSRPASKAPCTSANWSRRSKTIANTSKKWSRNALSNSRRLSSRSNAAMRTRCKRLAWPLTSATMKP